MHQGWNKEGDFTMTYYYVGIDIGTTTIKGVLIDNNYRHVDSLSAENKTYLPYVDWAEQEPEEILTTFKNVLNGLIERNSTIKSKIRAIGISSALFSIMALDKNNVPITPLMIWTDNRSIKEAEWLKSTVDSKFFYERTGCTIHPMYPLSKLLWLKNNKPEIFNKASKFVTIKEYIILRLFGEFLVDTSIASGSGFFDIHSKSWNLEILSTLGISQEQLSTTVPGTTVIPGSEKYMNWNIPFVVGVSDGLGCNVALGGLDQDILSSTIGTSGAIRILTNKILLDKNQRTWCYSLLNDIWSVGGAINNGCIVLNWFKELFQENDVSQEENLYELFNTYVKDIQAGSDGLIFLPFLSGERSPGWNAHMKGAIFGLTLKHGRKHMVKAIMEAVIYRMYSVYEALAELTAIEDRPIYANGGYANSDEWLQIQANIFNREILVPEVTDASAVGAAVIARMALNDYKTIQPYVSKKITPNYREVEIYKELYMEYKYLYNTVSKMYNGGGVN